jgi:hypothetical protein
MSSIESFITSISQKTLDGMSNEDLEKKAFHYVLIKNLLEHTNPLGCWAELKSEITILEVKNCINESNSELTATPLYLTIDEDEYKDELRAKHIQKIAYFVENETTKPIDIEIGFPEFNSHSCLNNIIDDGNHRLAGNFIAGNKYIKSSISGSKELALEMGIWNPNAYLKELEKRDELEYKERKLSQYNNFINNLKTKIPSKDENGYFIKLSITDFHEWCDIVDNYVNYLKNPNEKELKIKNLNIDSNFVLNISENDAKMLLNIPKNLNKVKIK